MEYCSALHAILAVQLVRGLLQIVLLALVFIINIKPKILVSLHVILP